MAWKHRITTHPSLRCRQKALNVAGNGNMTHPSLQGKP